MSDISEEVVAIARSWLGTRFRHQGRRKINQHDKGACDCIGLILGVANELHIKCRSSGQPIMDLDRHDYPLITSDNILSSALDYSFCKSSSLVAKPGDIMLMNVAGNAQHVGICSDYQDSAFGLIHAHLSTQKVVEHRLNLSFKYKIVAIYEFDTN